MSRYRDFACVGCGRVRTFWSKGARTAGPCPTCDAVTAFERVDE